PQSLVLAEVVTRAGSHGILRTEGIAARRRDQAAIDWIDVTKANRIECAIWPVQVQADREVFCSIGEWIDPARRYDRGAVADVPDGVIFNEAHRTAEVVAVWVWKQGTRQVQREQIDGVLHPGETALGLPALPQIKLHHLDAVQRIDTLIDQTANG